MIKSHIETLFLAALEQFGVEHEIAPELIPSSVTLGETKSSHHGDFACNVAMILAKSLGKNPRQLAQQLVACLPTSTYITKVEIAGPGFINFFISTDAYTATLKDILTQKTIFGASAIGRQKKVLVEFVSSNPTGPLHVGHGRHAAVGDVVVNLLRTVGFKPYKEYYVNDAGRQMDNLTISVLTRYLEKCGQITHFPANGYRGDYIQDMANTIFNECGNKFLIPTKELYADLPLDEDLGGDKDLYIDALVVKAQHLLGAHYRTFLDFGLTSILTDIKNDLAEFGVEFDNWQSERELATDDIVQPLLDKMTQNGCTYEREGALWFAAKKFGDEKDRVLIRSNGVRTYFANDVLYHLYKFERGFDVLLDVFGSDHHGYIPRMKAALLACGIDAERMTYTLLQFVSLYRNGKPMSMSTRGGGFVTLRELREEVGNDAARYFYVMRKCDQHMDFDLELAKARANENPVYYVQYAHARICSVLKQLAQRHLAVDLNEGLNNLSVLIMAQEKSLSLKLTAFPETIMNAAINYEPHILTSYLKELAAEFHGYYNSTQFIVDDSHLRNARLALILSVQQVLQNAFNILQITPVESM